MMRKELALAALKKSKTVYVYTAITKHDGRYIKAIKADVRIEIKSCPDDALIDCSFSEDTCTFYLG